MADESSSSVLTQGLNLDHGKGQISQILPKIPEDLKCNGVTVFHWGQYAELLILKGKKLEDHQMITIPMSSTSLPQSGKIL